MLQVEPASQKLLVSLKPTLVTSPLPRLASYEGAKAGMETHGVVAGVRPRSLLIKFLNDVQGIVLGSELQATLGALWESDPASCYWVGQAVKVRVLRCEPSKERLTLTFLSQDEAESLIQPRRCAM